MTNLNAGNRPPNAADQVYIFAGSFPIAFSYARGEAGIAMPTGPMAIQRILARTSDFADGGGGVGGWMLKNDVPPRMISIVMADPRRQWQALVNTSPPRNIFNFRDASADEVNAARLDGQSPAGVPDRRNPPPPGAGRKFVAPRKL